MKRTFLKTLVGAAALALSLPLLAQTKLKWAHVY